MKKIAITLGVLATAGAATASAATYYSTNDSTWEPRFVDANQECWNPRAGHFEGVRPGEVQADLDFNRCRTIGYSNGYSNGYGYNYENRYYNDNRYDNRTWRDSRQECWNPRARHFEELRAGERQDDLDYSRCRVYR